MSKAIKLITILIFLSFCLLGCALSPSSSIEEMIEGTYTITYTDEISAGPPFTYHILGEFTLADGEYTFTANPESLENFPGSIDSQLPMIGNPSGTYTISIDDEYKNLQFKDLPQLEPYDYLGTILFSSEDEPYRKAYLISYISNKDQKYISISSLESCLCFWSIVKIIP